MGLINIKILLILATVLTGLIAGFFYTWSFTIMQSLDLIETSEASNAMVSINENIRTGWFGLIFFGAPASVAVSSIAKITTQKKQGLAWILAALFFAISTLAITFTRHLPLNEMLAGGADWNDYSRTWVTWNHARMITSLLAFLSMILGFVAHVERGKR